MCVVSVVIDMHAHTLIAEVTRLVEGRTGFTTESDEHRRLFGAESVDHNTRLLRENWLRPLTDPPARLSLMDAAGVDVSVSPTQYHDLADAVLSCDIVDTVNAGITELVSCAPHRLVGLATVALQHPELAAEQFRRAILELGMPGVQISTSAGGRDFSHPKWMSSGPSPPSWMRWCSSIRGLWLPGTAGRVLSRQCDGVTPRDDSRPVASRLRRRSGSVSRAAGMRRTRLPCRHPRGGSKEVNTIVADDHSMITNLIQRFGRCLDAKDWAGYSSTFVADGVFEIFGQRRVGRAAIADGARELSRYQLTQHYITNVCIELDGDKAISHASVFAVHIPGRAEPSVHADVGGIYHHRCVRTADEGWLFAHVEVEVTWTAGIPFLG